MLQIQRKNAQVTYTDLAPEIEAAGPAIQEYFSRKGLQCLVTSARDGAHSKHSAHYTGRALDLRSRGVKAPQPFCIGLQKAIASSSDTGNYFVVWEGNHIHLEWCPKGEVPNIVGYRPDKFYYDSTVLKKKS